MRHAYDSESIIVCTQQQDGTTIDVHEVGLVITRQLYIDIGSFFKFAVSKKRSDYENYEVPFEIPDNINSDLKPKLSAVIAQRPIIQNNIRRVQQI